MSECKDERMGVGGNPSQPSFKIPLGSIKSIIQMIKCAFEVPEIPLPPITPEEITLGVQNRPGMSKQDTVARILNKKNKAGIPAGPNTDGSPNLSNVRDKIITEEIMDELMYKSVVEISIPKGGIKNQVNTSGGPTAQSGVGVNLNDIGAKGILR